MATTSTGTPSDAVPMTREELKETVASTICCHTRMSPAVQWEIDLLMGAIDKHVDLRLSQVQALCTQLPPNMPDPIETAVAHTAGWNDAMDKVQDALTRSGAPTEPRRVRP